MNDRELQALIRLLEDDDPGIKGHVEHQLLSLGEPIIPELEAAWENEKDERTQGRIADIIHLIQRQHTIDHLKTWREEGGANLLRGWHLVTQYQFPELDFLTYKQAINRLVSKIWLELRAGMAIRDKFRVINRMLFDKERFRPLNSHQLFDPQHYYLNGVLDTHKGSPLSLGMLYLIVCQELEIPVYGILLPGYFVLHYEDEKTEIFIDAYDKGSFFSRKDLKEFLKKKNIEKDQRYYQPSSSIHVIITLIQVLLYCHEQRKEPQKVREWELLLKGIAPDQGA